MNKKIMFLIKLLALALLLPVYAHAQISQLVLPAVKEEVKVQKVVFDCSSADKKYIASRLWLIDMSIQEYIANSTPYDVVLMIHSGCTDIVSKNVSSDDNMIKNISKTLQKISEYQNVSIEVCQIALDGLGIEHSDIHPFITHIPNSLTRVISLQNDGYAYIPFNK